MFSIVLLLLAAGFLQAQARDPGAPAPVGTATVRGVVLDGPTGSPIAGARVSLSARPTVTLLDDDRRTLDLRVTSVPQERKR